MDYYIGMLLWEIDNCIVTIKNREENPQYRNLIDMDFIYSDVNNEFNKFVFQVNGIYFRREKISGEKHKRVKDYDFLPEEGGVGFVFTSAFHRKSEEIKKNLEKIKDSLYDKYFK